MTTLFILAATPGTATVAAAFVGPATTAGRRVGILGPKVGGPLGPWPGLVPIRGANLMSGASNSVARGNWPGARGGGGAAVTEGSGGSGSEVTGAKGGLGGQFNLFDSSKNLG